MEFDVSSCRPSWRGKIQLQMNPTAVFVTEDVDLPSGIYFAPNPCAFKRVSAKKDDASALQDDAHHDTNRCVDSGRVVADGGASYKLKLDKPPYPKDVSTAEWDKDVYAVPFWWVSTSSVAEDCNMKIVYKNSANVPYMENTVPVKAWTELKLYVEKAKEKTTMEKAIKLSSISAESSNSDKGNTTKGGKGTTGTKGADTASKDKGKGKAKGANKGAKEKAPPTASTGTDQGEPVRKRLKVKRGQA